MLRQLLYPIFGVVVFGGYSFMETLPTEGVAGKGAKFAEKSQLEGKRYRGAPITWKNSFNVPKLRPTYTPSSSYSRGGSSYSSSGSSYGPRRSSYGGSGYK